MIGVTEQMELSEQKTFEKTSFPADYMTTLDNSLLVNILSAGDYRVREYSSKTGWQGSIVGYSSAGYLSMGSLDWIENVHIPLIAMNQHLHRQSGMLTGLTVPCSFADAVDGSERSYSAMLVDELVMAEVFKSKVANVNHSLDGQPHSRAIQIHCINYHELLVLNMLEDLVFHEPIIESLDSSALEILEYCYRKVCFMHQAEVELTSTKDCS